MSPNSHLPDQPIMKYVHPADRLRPWFGVAVGLAALVGMLAFGILGCVLFLGVGYWLSLIDRGAQGK